MSVDPPDSLFALAIVLRGAAALGLDVSPEARRQFTTYCDLLQEANQRVNLTGIRDAEGIMRTLFLDSLTALPLIEKYVPAERQTLVVDVGSGAGIPGLPLKIVRPRWRMVLVESVRKKARFLESVVEALTLEDVTIRNERAEESGWRPELRDKAHIVLARAVAPLTVLVELCAPIAHAGGILVFPKSGDVSAEVDEARRATRILRAELVERWPVPEALGLGAQRFVVVYRKCGATPDGYPRRIGLARSRPLGSDTQGAS